MDRDDPERRIADLERQLAQRQRGAGLPPASADAVAASGRFVATGYKVASFYNWGSPRTFVICVTSDGLTVDQMPGDVFAFRDAQLGLWVFGSMTMGTALHLQCGAHRFVLGGRDYRVATDPELEAAPVDRVVDAWLWASDFYELLTGIASRTGLDVRGAVPGAPTRCWLVSTSTIRAAGYSTLADTFARGIKQSLAIDVGKDAIWVMDPYTNALVASAWLTQVTATPAKRKYTGRSGSATLPILVVCVPGVHPLSIGCLDRGVQGPEYSYKPWGPYRFSWRGAVPEDNEPAFWTSGADWLTLVAKLGLAPYLEAPR